jgi:hypothetical protein
VDCVGRRDPEDQRGLVDQVDREGQEVRADRVDRVGREDPGDQEDLVDQVGPEDRVLRVDLLGDGVGQQTSPA